MGPTHATDHMGAMASPESESPHRIVVHRWDVRAPLAPEVVEEINRAHRLRNRLVEIDKAHELAKAEVWARHPEVAHANSAVDEASEAVKAANDAVAAWKVANGSTRPPADLRDARAAARRALKEAKATRKAVRDAAYPAVKAGMVEARRIRDEAVKAQYRVSVDDGLYHASYNDVRAKHDVAVRRIASQRGQGKAAELRFHRWQGEGTITVQLVRQAGKPARTAEMLGSEKSPWRNVLALIDYPTSAEWASMSKSDVRRHARGGVTRLRWRIGSGEHASIVELPVAVGRPIPDGADIVAAQLTRRVVAGKERASVAVTMRVPHVTPITEGPAVSVHIGWRALGDGAIRTAVVSGCSAPPDELVDAGVVRWHGTWGEVVAPASWRARDERLAGVASTRDKAHNIAKAALVEWLIEHPDKANVIGRGGPEPLLPHRVTQWRSPAHLAKLTIDHPAWMPPELHATLEAWRRQDHHLWQWHANGTDALVARRLDLWRKVANWIANGAAVVTVDEWSVSDLTVRADDSDRQEDAARRQARLASPGLLRSQIKRAVGAAGGQMADHEANYQTHYGCGGVLDAEARKTSVVVPCGRCGLHVDQDHNALRSQSEVARGLVA